MLKSLGEEILKFNPNGKKIKSILLDEGSMNISKIHDLRAATYQTEESTQGLKDVKQKM